MFGGGDMQDIFQRAMDGKLGHSKVRSIAWKVFLGILPANNNFEEWKQEAQKHRRRFEQLRQVHMIDPYKETEDLDPTIHNPLTQNEDSAWKTYFENTEAQREINQDLTRLYPGDEFFHREEIQQSMLHVLFIWSRENPLLSYRQGMHELLALLVLALVRDQTEPSSGDSVLHVVTSSAFIEHDSYCLFDKLMETMRDWFESKPQVYRKPPTSISSLVDKQSASRDLFDVDETEQSTESLIVELGKKVQDQLLRERDHALYEHLTRLGVEPQLYTLRWVRLLFSREFHMEDTMLLWDAIFADSADLHLVEHLCVAMLLYIRSQLLEMNYEGCMRRLLKYPPVEDVHQFISKALASRKNQRDLLKDTIPVAPPPAHQPPQASPIGTVSRRPAGASTFNKSRPRGAHQQVYVCKPTSASSSSSSSSSHAKHRKESPAVVEELEEQLAAADKQLQILNKVHDRAGRKIQELVVIIENQMRQTPEERNEDDVFMAIAQLKHVRDELLDRIGDEEAPPLGALPSFDSGLLDQGEEPSEPVLESKPIRGDCTGPQAVPLTTLPARTSTPEAASQSEKEEAEDESSVFSRKSEPSQVDKLLSSLTTDESQPEVKGNGPHKSIFP